MPNSGSEELHPPQHGITVAGNTVYSNNNARTAAISIAQPRIGTGILVAGGDDDVVEHNLVYDHDIVGIGVIPLPEKVINPKDPKSTNFDARRNRVVSNNVSNSAAPPILHSSRRSTIRRTPAATASPTTGSRRRCRRTSNSSCRAAVRLRRPSRPISPASRNC